MIKKFHFFIKTFALLLIITACATGPELDKYSRREIDRPYTLPKSVANWEIPTMISHTQDDKSCSTSVPIPLPIFWNKSLSDDWNVHLSPIALGASHQISNNEMARLGFSVFTGILPMPKKQPGPYWRSGFSFNYRHKFSDKFGLDLVPTFHAEIPLEANSQNWNWQAGLSSGPLFQLSDTFAFKPLLLLAVNRDHVNNVAAAMNVGFGLSSVLSITRQWDFRPSYTYSGIMGSKNGYRNHAGEVNFVHFW